MSRTFLFTLIAMVAFAANSLLARPALGDGTIDAAGYTVIRLVSGAVFLFLLTRFRTQAPVQAGRGSWLAALALFVYALAFSFAYLALGAATGALILFSSVQATMIIYSLIRGEHPSRWEMAGFVVSFVAFVYLILPGVGKPDLVGSVLMIVSGVAWGFYTLIGRGSVDPLADTTGNFMRAAVYCVPPAVYAYFSGYFAVTGVVLALVSGAIASGAGYAIWYRALPGLSAFQAALVQLSVPVIAAIGAASLLGEAVTLRFGLTSLCLLGGIAIATVMRQKRV